MPSDLLLARVLLRSRLAADHKTESAILELDIAGAGLWRPSAVITGRLDHDGLARRALTQRRFLAGLAFLVRRGCGAAVDVERPLDMVLGQTVAKHGTGMVEDHGVGFAVGRTQHAAHHLPE